MSAMAVATYVLVALFAGSYLIFFIVITIGGFMDLKKLLAAIKSEVIQPDDDGCHPTREASRDAS